MAEHPTLQSLYPFLHGVQQDAARMDAALLESIEQKTRDGMAVKERFFRDNGAAIVAAARTLAEVYEKGGRLFTMGNGGSSCDAAHIAVEFQHPVTAGRPALPAINLAEMLSRGLDSLQPSPNSLVFIENVGNLVCPALFDLGEHAKVAILSVTEGEDKPLKYPHMFRASHLMLLNKIDLLPYLKFDVARCVANAREVNPQIEVLEVSATSGAGMDAWYDWLRRQRPLTP